MALQKLEFSFKPAEEYTSFSSKWSHSGVVGSGDMEILMERREQNGRVTIQVVTPVTGFDHIWKRVLERFVEESAVGDLHLEINDNNTTPFIVALRLKQALIEAKEVE